MGLWDDFTASDIITPAGMIAGGLLGIPAGNPLAGAAIGGAIGSWVEQQVAPSGDTTETAPDFYTPEQRQLIAERQDALKTMLEDMPSADERFEVSKANIGAQVSTGGQGLVSDAARRGLLHSGILAAEKAKLQQGATGALVQARLEAERGATADRAAILDAISRDRPLPEVTVYEEDRSQALPFGLAGAGAGAVLGGPQGAMAGYQIGSGLGQYATESSREPSRRATPVDPRWREV